LSALIGKPLGLIMSFVYGLVQNYGVAIIIFTLLTKIILLPVTYKQQKNAARMASLNPQLSQLRKSYANNKARFQEEQMKLYQKEGVNPMGSCLPALIQMILLFGIFDVINKPMTHIMRFKDTVIGNATEIAAGIDKVTVKAFNSGGRPELNILNKFKEHGDAFASMGTEFTDKMSNFASNFKFLGLDMGRIPQFKFGWDSWGTFVIFMIPIFAGIVQLISSIYTQSYQKKTNPDAPAMAGMGVMVYLAPLLSVWFAYKFPAGLGFYWIFSTLFSLMITVLINRHFTQERVDAIIEKDREKAKKNEAMGKGKGFMQRMMEQQQAMQQNDEALNEKGEKMSKSELNSHNRKLLSEARKKLAEKYGDEYDDE